jgi:hypothetical protein
MAKVGTIGNVDHGKTTLSADIKSVLEKEKYNVYQDVIEESFEFTNPYPLLDTRSPSKSRVKKCKKGLHEFIETGHDTVRGRMFSKRWACRHCNTDMIDRK